MTETAHSCPIPLVFPSMFFFERCEKIAAKDRASRPGCLGVPEMVYVFPPPVIPYAKRSACLPSATALLTAGAKACSKRPS